MFPDPAIVTYPVFKAVLLAINAIWPPAWACAYAFRSDFVKVPVNYGDGVQGYRLESLPPVPSDPTFPYSPFHITWLARCRWLPALKCRPKSRPSVRQTVGC